MKKERVFITRKILDDGPNLLKSKGLDVALFPHDHPIDKETLSLEAQKSDALITMLTDPIDRDFLIKNSHLKVISNYAVGFNNIDIKTASELNIPIGNTPDVLTNATAELAVGLMIACSRNFHEASHSVYNGEWIDWSPTNFLGPELTGKTLGIIGLGRIGKRVAEIAVNGFLVKVLYTSQTSETPLGVRLPLNELLTQSDFISLHLPLTPQTQMMIGKKELSLMKNTAILINTSRGEIINQMDLIWALENKIIRGAGLDVTSPEPLPLDSHLLSLKNVYITPHIGSGTFEARRAMSLICAENIILGLKKEKLKGFVNPLVFKN
jgi:glyoxylate reductase